MWKCLPSALFSVTCIRTCLALPFAFLSLAVALVWWLEAGKWRLPDQSGLAAVAHPGAFLSNPILWFFTALIMGRLSFLNTWDFLIHLFVVLGAFFLARWRVDGLRIGRLLTHALIMAVLLLAPIILLYLPFYLGFRSQAGAPYLLPMLMRPTRLSQFVVVFGMPLWAISILLLALALRQRCRHWQAGLFTAVTLIALLFLATLLFGWIIAASPDGAGRVIGLANELGLNLPARPPEGAAPGWGAAALFAITPALIQAKISYPALTLFLAGMIALVVMIWRERLDKPVEVTDSQPGPLPFALLLILTGALLTLGPEFLYLRDNFGFRLNTIFKFYYQAWVLFGVAALFGLGYLWHGWRGSKRAWPIAATVGYGLALLLALLFPYFAVQSRMIEFRGADLAQPATLNGLANLQRFTPDEYNAILWLRENVPDAPVILEAVGGQYSQYGRFAANTGLPTLLGWAGHEYQWRGDTPEPGQRDPAVRDIYSRTDLGSVANLLNQYGVEYIVVGNLERDTYGLQGLDKFSENLDVAFSDGGVTIYRWQPN